MGHHGAPSFWTMPCLDYAIKDAVQARYAHQNMATLTFTINMADNANNNEGENFMMVFSNDRDESRTKSCRIPVGREKKYSASSYNSGKG